MFSNYRSSVQGVQEGFYENLFLLQQSKSGYHNQYSHYTAYEQLEVDKYPNSISKPQNSFRHQILLKE
jgi:hypothetical protein